MEPGWQIRKATAEDAQAIRALILRVKINPTGLKWQRFMVAKDAQGRLLGCGQIKPHGDGSRELASIAVQPEVQGQGIGTQIIQRLLEENPSPLYLTCRARMGRYYERFGFEALRPEAMPPYFKRIYTLFRIIQKVFPGKMKNLLVMQKGTNQNRS